MRPRPTLFIDIDGVLAPFGRRNPRVVDHAAVERLRRILAATGARVVLSSSWPLDEARELLRPHGIAVSGALPIERRYERGRPTEIGRYLFAHPRVRRWAAIDDDDLRRVAAHSGESDPARRLLREPGRTLKTLWVRHIEGAVDGAGLDEEIATAAIRWLLTDEPAEARPRLDEEIAQAKLGG